MSSNSRRKLLLLCDLHLPEPKDSGSAGPSNLRTGEDAAPHSQTRICCLTPTVHYSPHWKSSGHYNTGQPPPPPFHRGKVGSRQTRKHDKNVMFLRNRGESSTNTSIILIPDPLTPTPQDRTPSLQRSKSSRPPAQKSPGRNQTPTGGGVTCPADLTGGLHLNRTSFCSVQEASDVIFIWTYSLLSFKRSAAHPGQPRTSAGFGSERFPNKQKRRRTSVSHEASTEPCWVPWKSC